MLTFLYLALSHCHSLVPQMLSLLKALPCYLAHQQIIFFSKPQHINYNKLYFFYFFGGGFGGCIKCKATILMWQLSRRHVLLLHLPV